MRPIEKQTILITGATGGLGWELAQALADQGATLLLHGRDTERGLETVGKLKEATGNNRIQFCRADLSSLVEVRELSKQVISSVTQLDVLVNNAGVGFGKDASKRELSQDGYDTTNGCSNDWRRFRRNWFRSDSSECTANGFSFAVPAVSSLWSACLRTG